jgi:hypothetical protein
LSDPEGVAEVEPTLRIEPGLGGELNGRFPDRLVATSRHLTGLTAGPQWAWYSSAAAVFGDAVGGRHGRALQRKNPFGML